MDVASAPTDVGNLGERPALRRQASWLRRQRHKTANIDDEIALLLKNSANGDAARDGED